MRIAAAASWLLIAALAGRARAGDERAAADFFRAGKAAYARGDYRAAATAFEAAGREAPAAATRYNAALAWELAREPARAADAYDAALAWAGGLNEEQLRDAQQRLAKLVDGLGRLEISGPPGSLVSVAHVDSATLPVRVHVSPGEHRLSVVIAGRGSQTRVVRVAAGATRSVAFAEPERPASGAAPPAAPEPSAPLAPTSAPDEDATSPLIVGGWIAIGTGVALGVATGILGASALEANDEFDRDRTNADARDEAVALRTWTNAALGGAIVFAGAGVTMLVLAPSKPERVSVRFGPGSVSAGGRF